MLRKYRALIYLSLFVLTALGSLGVGVMAEYKFYWVDALRAYWYPKAALPELDSRLNARAGRHLPAIAPLPSSLPERALWREQTRQRIERQIPGALFPLEPVYYAVVAESEQNGLIEQELVFTSFDGQRIPARLFTPARAKSSPAVLLVPGHVKNGQSGLLQLADETRSYQRAAARQLAQAGFVTLAFELRGFGYLGEPEFAEHRAVAYNALQRGESYKSLILKDTARAMALLRQLPQVNGDRTAIAGASYGGEIAVEYAALDSRVAAVSFHSFGGWRGKEPMLGSGAELPHFCHLFPMVDDWVGQEHWLWLLAPRAVQGVRGHKDQKQFLAQHELYARGWENPDDLRLQVEQGRHEFFVDAAIAFFKSRL